MDRCNVVIWMTQSPALWDAKILGAYISQKALQSDSAKGLDEGEQDHL